jgi:hypothetical protein
MRAAPTQAIARDCLRFATSQRQTGRVAPAAAPLSAV